MPPKPEERKVSDEMRRAILKNCESFPDLSKSHLKPHKHHEDFLALCELVNRDFPREQHVDARTVGEIISCAKSTFSRKLKFLILNHRIVKSEVDVKMGTWEFYSDFKFYRKKIQKCEDQWWEMQAIESASMASKGAGSLSSTAPSTSSTPAPPSSTTAPKLSTPASTSSTSARADKPPQLKEQNISDEVRRAILKSCEAFPSLSKRHLKPTRHHEEFKALCELVNKKFPKEHHVDARTAGLVISRAKTTLTRKLNYLILHHRIARNEIDDRMGTWDLYSDFKFYRQNIQDLEEQWWEMQAELDTSMSTNGTAPSSSSAPSTSTGPGSSSLQHHPPAATTPSTTAPTPSTSTPSHGSSRSAKLQIQKLHMALVKKGSVTGGLRSGNSAYARNSRLALRDYQRKFANTKKLFTTELSTRKRPVIVRSAALTAAISSAAKLRKTGAQVNSPAPSRSISSSVSRSRSLNGLTVSNIIAVPKLSTRKRVNQPEFARTARLAARQEQQEAKNDDVDTAPEPASLPDTPSTSIVFRGAKRMKLDSSSTSAVLSATDRAESSSTQAGPSGSTPVQTVVAPVDSIDANQRVGNVAGPSSTPRPAAGPSATTPKNLRSQTKIGRFTRAAQPDTPAIASDSTGDSQVTVTKAGKPMKARARAPTLVQVAAVNDDYRSSLPLAIVISNDRNKLQAGQDRVKILNTFVAEVPDTCTEAIRAIKFGQQIRNRQYPGIPDRKFFRNNYAKYGSDESLTWPMQAAFEMKDHPKMWYVYFEGWTIPYAYEESQLKESGEDTLEAGKIRRDFLNKMATLDVTKDCLDRVRYCGNKRKTDSLFWDYEDLSYFHTKIHFEDGLGPIFYMNLSKDCEKPPTYSYTTTNIMDVKVYNWCLQQKMNWTIQKLDSKKKLANVEKATGCENPSGCVCNRRFAHLYEDVINLQTKNGLLQVTQSKRDSPRISIECSDACGCSHNCPRRHMQRGNRKALVVNFEGSRKGMGLRAGANYKKGEYIGEYTGILKQPVDGEDQSYEAAVSLMAESFVICSRKCGNIIRFMSHSCSPNAMFVVTWSRVKESDPLLPKIAVFATDEIKMGEEITICYWTAEDRDAATEFVKCWCGTKDCIQELPVIS